MGMRWEQQAIVVLGGIILLSGCGLLSTPQAIVMNQSGQTLSRARLTLCDQAQIIENLPSGQKFSWDYDQNRDCSLDIQGTLADGKPLKSNGAYVDSGDMANQILTIDSTGQVTHERR